MASEAERPVLVWHPTGREAERLVAAVERQNDLYAGALADEQAAREAKDRSWLAHAGRVEAQNERIEALLRRIVKVLEDRLD